MKPLPIRSYADDTFHKFVRMAHTSRAANARALARLFCESAFSNLDDFHYVYFTAGITEAINYLVHGNQVTIARGDYRYAFMGERRADGKKIEYKSFPFAGDGKFRLIDDGMFHALDEGDVVLDCAYMFASDMSHDRVLPPNVRQVMFSFSKGHNLSLARLGWFFSKDRIDHLHVLQYEYDYVSSVAESVLKGASSMEPNFLYLKYREEYSNLYKSVGLSEGNTNLFGVDPRTGARHPYYTI